VSRGDVVSRGQVIGYAGKSGDVSSPQVHFEIRRDTQPVNPKPLLVARSS
jgi:murein DD-endopeptidase MepM/ murein hydrolase activator NlpD